MKIQRIIICLLAALLSMTAVAPALSAQNTVNDFGTWTTLEAIKSWGKPVLVLHIEHRSKDNVSTTEACFGSLGAGYSFTNWLSLDASYEYWRLPSSKTNLHKGVLALTGTLKCDKLSFKLREKYELAFNQAGGNPTSTLRSRIRGQYTPDNFCMRPYFMYEFFNGFGKTGGWQRSLHYVGSDIVVDKHNIFDIYYMYHIYPGSEAGACSSHILGVTYRVVF